MATFSDFSAFGGTTWALQFKLLALLTLQLLGGMGIFTISLFVLRDTYKLSTAQPQSGWIFGLTGYLFTAAAAQIGCQAHLPQCAHRNAARTDHTGPAAFVHETRAG